MTAPGVRWTVGDVSSRGWEALRLSVHCAYRLFGPAAAYSVCLNTVPLETARERVGALPDAVEWRVVTLADLPRELAGRLDPAMAEGVGWKLIPAQLWPGRHELSLDNDCILWERPAALRQFLDRNDATLMAEDVDRCLGQFQDDSAVPGCINSGIRGLPPGFALAPALARTLTAYDQTASGPMLLRSELDEQGLQAAALHRHSNCLVIAKEEVSICSPFWPRQLQPGTCGAHFVGLNSRHLPWHYYDEPGDLVRRRHWDEHRPALYAKAGLPMPPAFPLDAA